jgi:hypothetical protein
VARGSLFEIDDRWRAEGPTTAVAHSLALRGELLDDPSLAIPLERDWARFDDPTNAVLDATTLGTADYVYDAWVKVDEFAEYQTILWIGDPTSDPSKRAGTTAGTSKLYGSMRLARGYPEFAFGSSDTYGGGLIPEKGIFIARSATRVPLGEWVHVRFQFGGGVRISSATCFVNGRATSVTLSASGDAAAGSWLLLSTIPTPTRVFIGVSHDGYFAPGRDKAFQNDVLEGLLLQPNVISGYVHSLDGQVAFVAIGTVNIGQGNFDPFSVAYSTTKLLVLCNEGIGHKLIDAGLGQHGVIYAHPAVSLFHEMGFHDQPASWAPYGNRLFVTNGGRPAYVSVAE